jgi:hypothetical protein
MCKLKTNSIDSAWCITAPNALPWLVRGGTTDLETLNDAQPAHTNNTQHQKQQKTKKKKKKIQTPRNKTTCDAHKSDIYGYSVYPVCQ